MELLSRDILSLSHDTTKFTHVRKDKTSVHSNKVSVKCTPLYLLEVMASLWGYSIQSSALHSVFCDAKIHSLDFIFFFFFVSINIYLCVWFSPQKCSNICSTIVARNHYLLNALPRPCGVPTGTRPASQLGDVSPCVHTYFPLPTVILHTTQIIFESPGRCHYWNRKDVNGFNTRLF